MKKSIFYFMTAFLLSVGLYASEKVFFEEKFSKEFSRLRCRKIAGIIVISAEFGNGSRARQTDIDLYPISFVYV